MNGTSWAKKILMWSLAVIAAMFAIAIISAVFNPRPSSTTCTGDVYTVSCVSR
jgi:hypothetical protein